MALGSSRLIKSTNIIKLMVDQVNWKYLKQTSFIRKYMYKKTNLAIIVVQGVNFNSKI